MYRSPVIMTLPVNVVPPLETSETSTVSMVTFSSASAFVLMPRSPKVIAAVKTLS